MRKSAPLACVALLCCVAISAAATAQTPADGRIIRVVYQLAYQGGGPHGATWGLHLAHMTDGRYCVRLGNPGRLNLSIIEKVSDICFDKMPDTVEKSVERRSQSFDAREKGKQITVISFQKGSIRADGNAIALDITTCNRIEGEAETRCFPNRYIVRMNGPDCSAEVTLSAPRSRAENVTCEHYQVR